MGIKSSLRTIPVARSARELLTGLGEISNTPFKSIARNLEKFKISGVIDVGANVGQFGLDVRRHGFEKLIVSYEPVQETFRSLSQTIKQHQPWKAFQLGLGDTESEKYINISGNAGLSSSLLTMGKVHIENFPESTTISTQKVSISTLDNQLQALDLDPEKILLKLDVQGYEAEVLKGAVKSMSRIPLCFLEVSIVPLYEGEITLLPILKLLSESGHEVIDVFRGLKTKNGQLLQLDILTKQVSSKSS
jgi:FkbM family methyltransferase